MQLEQLVKEYLLELKLENYSKRTIETYRQHINKFISFYKEEIDIDLDIDNISKIHYKLFISQLLDNSLRATYINAILKSNKALWNYLVLERVLKTSPMDSIKLLKEDKQTLTTFNDKEIKSRLSIMAVENFVQIPNKMFVDTNNDEKLVYVKLLQSQVVGYLDKDNRTTMTTVPVLITLLGWSKSQYSNKKVITALNGLKEKYYINFESTKDVFVVVINKWNDKEKYELDVDWRESNVTFSGHTQIKYSVIDNLLENKDFTLYAYTEYRTMKKHQYRISYEEWALVLGMTKDGAFKNVNSSEVVVKVSHGYNKNTKKRETNSYLTFDKAELVEETAKKPTYEAQDESEKVSEPVVDDVSETKDDVVEDEKVEETVTKTISDEDIKDIQEQWKKITGNTREQNILKKMNDPRVTTVEQANQIQDFNYPMSLEMPLKIKHTLLL